MSRLCGPPASSPADGAGVSAAGGGTPRAQPPGRRRSVLVALLLLAPVAQAGFIIELDRTASFKRSDLLRDLGTIRHEYRAAFFGAAVDLPPDALDDVRKLPYVRAVYEDHRIEPFEKVEATTTFAMNDAAARVHASALPTRGEGIVVAVVDSGIDAAHPALAGKIAGGYDFAQNDPVPEDIEGHGTHVAGIIAAYSAEIRGVAPGVTLLIYKVVHRNGDGLESSVVAALERAIDPNGDGDPSDHVDVVNISLGWDRGADSVAARAVEAATAAGVTVVVAAGNTTQSPARVKSPGVAPSAITVANAASDVDVAFDSARGPTPGTLAFKPDLAAPGTGIVSTHLGGAYVSLSGTSMASPHVAGVAALLKKLHPDWTPAAIKAALLATARPMNAPSLARGAGHADAQAAHERRFTTGVAGLSFGIHALTTGNFTATRSITITNHTAAEAAFTSSAAGAAVSITPAAFTLAPGASRTLSVRITIDAAMEFPRDRLAGGAIRLQSGATIINIPWGIVRAARATVSYDESIDTLFATSPARVSLPYLYAPGEGEMFAAPGETWDFVLTAGSRFLAAEGVAVRGDERIVLRAADATRTFVLDARDANNTPLSAYGDQHTVSLRMLLEGAALDADTLAFGDVDALHVSPLSSRFRLTPMQSVLDVDAHRAYAALHDELRGDGGTSSAPPYVNAKLLWKSGTTPFSTSAHMADAVVSTASGIIANGTRFDVFLTPGVSISLGSDAVSIPPLRVLDGAIVGVPDRTAAPSAYRVTGGTQVDIDGELVHPFAFFGTAAQRPGAEYRAGLIGALGERYAAAAIGTPWTLFDANGGVAANGTLDANHASANLAIAPRSRFVAAFADASVLDVAFGANADDLAAPTLTSLRVEHGRTLRFSAADLEYGADLRTKLSRPEATRVSWRATGTDAWAPLQVVLEGTEHGSVSALGHVPAGDIYRVALPPRLTQLRIEIEDAAGNRSAWTQPFEMEPVVRRRSVRK